MLHNHLWSNNITYVCFVHISYYFCIVFWLQYWCANVYAKERSWSADGCTSRSREVEEALVLVPEQRQAGALPIRRYTLHHHHHHHRINIFWWLTIAKRFFFFSFWKVSKSIFLLTINFLFWIVSCSIVFFFHGDYFGAHMSYEHNDPSSSFRDPCGRSGTWSSWFEKSQSKNDIAFKKG